MRKNIVVLIIRKIINSLWGDLKEELKFMKIKCHVEDAHIRRLNL